MLPHLLGLSAFSFSRKVLSTSSIAFNKPFAASFDNGTLMLVLSTWNVIHFPVAGADDAIKREKGKGEGPMETQRKKENRTEKMMWNLPLIRRGNGEFL
jgi:hypothetical protein